MTYLNRPWVDGRDGKTSWMHRSGVAALLLFGLGLSTMAWGLTPLDVDVLDTAGFSADDVLLTWNERAGDGGLVHGIRLAPEDAEPFDLYYDTQGQALGDSELDALGIVAKDWEWRSVTQSSHPGAAPKTLAQPPVPRAAKAGLPAEVLMLPEVDVAAALAEDELGLSTPSKSVARVGVFQEFGPAVVVGRDSATDGDWRAVADGRVWALTIFSPGALGQRLHFADVQLPDGAALLVYDADDPGEVYGPLSREGAYWSPTCFAERVVVECFVPADAASAPLSFSIDRSTHQYRGLGAWAKQAADCHLDVACAEDWAQVAAGVGGLGLVGRAGMLFCTGTLLADMDEESAVPYFLTANHCVSSVAWADSVEIYWLYQAAACGETPPDPANVPRTQGGADYLAGSPADTGTDVTLLRLRNAPPAGITYVGYSSDAAAVETDVVCIHHPSGDYKRISYGVITDNGSPRFNNSRLDPIERYHEVSWNEDGGTTEPGSSGSPLLLADTGLIIGQLYEGLASCEYVNEPDYYGRFDVSLALMRRWVGNVASQPREYRLKLNVTGKGRIVIDNHDNPTFFVSESATYTVGKDLDVVLAAIALEGEYEFSGWEGTEESTQNPLEITMNANRSYTAVFEKEEPEPIKGCFGTSSKDGEEPLAAALTCLPLLLLWGAARARKVAIASRTKE